MSLIRNESQTGRTIATIKSDANFNIPVDQHLAIDKVGIKEFCVMNR